MGQDMFDDLTHVVIIHNYLIVFQIDPGTGGGGGRFICGRTSQVEDGDKDERGVERRRAPCGMPLKKKKERKKAPYHANVLATVRQATPESWRVPLDFGPNNLAYS